MRNTAGSGTTPKKEKSPQARRRSYLKRLTLAALAMGTACFTLIFFGPFENVAFGGNAMAYSHRDIWWILALAALTVWVAGTLLLSLIKGKLFRRCVSLVFSVTACGYLQALFLNSTLGSLTGDAVDWQSKLPNMLLSVLLWLGITGAVYVILRRNRAVWRKVVIYGSALLLVMQGASTVSILLGNSSNTSSREYCLTDSGMYEYSSQDNIFVFVLDRLDYGNITKILQQDPDFFEPLDGFTSYTNAVSAYARTQPALTHLLTGSEAAFTCPSKTYYDDAWEEDGKHILQDLEAQDYSIELYSMLRYLFSDPAYAATYVDNVAAPNRLDPVAALVKLLQLSAYRHSPTPIKPLFWADTAYYNSGVLLTDSTNAYLFQDIDYMPGLSRSTAQRDQNSFKFYHFYGSHAPYNMHADGSASSESTSVTEQTMGCFTHLFNAFRRMKELGIYEDATIIITADHGNAWDDTKPVQVATRIGLFYKPSGSAGTPLQLSGAPVCTDNVSATIAKAAGLRDYSAYGPALDDIAEDAQVTRYYYKTLAIDGWERTVCKYAITGDAADFSNWKLIEQIEDLPEEYSFY